MRVALRPIAAFALLAAMPAVANAAPKPMAASTAATVTPAVAKADVIQIYHLEGRRSGRVIWLCEELGLPYELKFKPGDFAASKQMLENVNPLMPMWPTVVIDGKVLVESGGILEYILSRYGNGRLQPDKDSDDYPYYLQWMHFAEGTAMYRAWAERYASMIAKIPIDQMPIGRSERNRDPNDKSFKLVGTVAVLEYMNDWLGKHPYFGGKDFSAADIMMEFFARGSKLQVWHDSMDYPNIAAWRKRLQSRPAYVRANNAAVPQGWNEYGLPKDMPLPFDPPPEKKPTSSSAPAR